MRSALRQHPVDWLKRPLVERKHQVLYVMMLHRLQIIYCSSLTRDEIDVLCTRLEEGVDFIVSSKSLNHNEQTRKIISNAILK
jgi:hypothetical protein